MAFPRLSNQVYVMECDGIYKIGITGNLKRRLFQIQKDNPNKVSCLWSSFVDDAAKCESMLHEKYAHLRQSGEWFALTEDDLLDIKSQVESLTVHPSVDIEAQFYLRLSSDLLGLLRRIAVKEDRSLNGQMVRYLRIAAEGGAKELGVSIDDRSGRKKSPATEEEAG